MMNGGENTSKTQVLEQGLPLVSVIVPVFNGARFLSEMLESIQTQKYSNLEIVVVDDGSTDGSLDILESFFDSWQGKGKILAHPQRQNLGVAASYILGLENTQGKYIAFLEQDDFWADNKISEQVRIFEKLQEVGVVFSDVYVCDDNGAPSADAFNGILNRPPIEKPFHAFGKLLWGNYVLTFSNIMVRKNLTRVRGDIIAEPEGFQDWMLLLLLSSRCRFYKCGSTRTYWRQTRDSLHAKIKTLPNYGRKKGMVRVWALKRMI